jgi:hypothetical protein
LGGIDRFTNYGEHQFKPGLRKDREELVEFFFDLVLKSKVLSSRVLGVLPLGADALYKQVQAVDSVLLLEKAKRVKF